MGPGASPRFGAPAMLAVLFACAGSSCQHPGGGAGVAGAGGAGTPGQGGAGGSSSGAGGSAADGSAGDGGPWRGPAPATVGHNFPFPQNRASASCTYPQAYRNEDVQAAYAQWVHDTVVDDPDSGGFRVRRPQDPVLDADSTVSEGIGYGMIIAVYMDDQMHFDGFWKYEQKHLDTHNLMNWYILANGQLGMNGANAASDADEDMAFALVMADRQWSGKGSLARNYIDYATDQIANVWNYDVVHTGNSHLMSGGDSGWDWSCVNISYFAPAYYRVFAQIDGNTAGWDAVIKTVYDTMDNALNPAVNGGQANHDNGLVPAWCHSEGPPNPSCPSGATNYQYDSCRTPFRIALDWCWFGTAAAHDYLAKTSAFFSARGATAITDGYDLNGTPHPQFGAAGGQSAAFVGPAAVGAMSDVAYQSFVDQAYTDVAGGQLLIGGRYYDESWTVMSLLMMTGNLLDYRSY
jgi:endo-1,4-beta-D-glucanase Y